MARIRSIKPEFPQSETMGRLSRDARLLFIMLWTIVDDEGRARANPRMLASLLYPYDDDVPSEIDGWLAELDERGCVRRYEVSGSHFLDIPNWLKHQKIDHPAASKLPPFESGSPILAKIPEALAPDLGPRIGLEEEDANASDVRADAKAVDAEFEREFWPRYRNKVGRPKALQAYRAARKKTEASVILAGLDRYIREKPPDRHWLNPATFLNQARWEDEPAPEPINRGPPMLAGNHFASLANRFRESRNVQQRSPDEGAFDGPELELQAGGHRQ